MDPAERAAQAGDVTLEDLDHGSIVLEGTTLVLTGEIDHVLMALWTRENTPVPEVDTVDTHAVTFFGSAGMTLLIRLNQRRPVVVRAHGPAVLRVLETTGLTSVLSIDTSA